MNATRTCTIGTPTTLGPMNSLDSRPGFPGLLSAGMTSAGLTFLRGNDKASFFGLSRWVMQKLFTFNVGENAQVGLLKDLLEKSFIRCVIRNEYLSVASGEIPFTECYPELWILNDEDYPRAKEVLDGWLSPQFEAAGSWFCRRCEEEIEGQFASCWKCGTQRED
jgi:Putative prokaryotic signal transducing protein